MLGHAQEVVRPFLPLHETQRDAPCAAIRCIVDDRFVFNSGCGSTTAKEEWPQGVLRMGMTGQDITARSVLIEDDNALAFGTT